MKSNENNIKKLLLMGLIGAIITFIGGDTDTIACIVGGMAEALYGVPQYLIDIVKNKLPSKFNKLLEKGYEKVSSI